MADLKNPIEPKLAVYAASEEGVRAVKAAAEHVLKEMEVAVRAQAALPKTVTDLIANAEKVFVSEFEAKQLRFFGGYPDQVSIQLNIGGHGLSLYGGARVRDEGVMDGRYRAIVVLQRLGDRKESS